MKNKFSSLCKLNFSNCLYFKSIRPFSIDYSTDTQDFLKNYQGYEKKLTDVLHEYELLENAIKGNATVEKTLFYSTRNKDNIHKNHFKKTYEDLTISTIGIGSYLGKPDDLTDFYLYNNIKTAVLSGGINVIDTAINYRYMKSERAIGKALKTLIFKYKIAREELILCSKIGFIPEDADNGFRSHYFVEKLIEDGKLDINDVIYDELKRPVHCINPNYLETQLNLSLKNLDIETLDVLYLHNVYETNQSVKDITNLSKAIEFLEKKRSENKIKYYGFASWNSFRVPESHNQYGSIQKLVEICEKVAGKDHGFKYIQAPINLLNPEFFLEKYQRFNIYEKSDILKTYEKKGTLSASINIPYEGEDKKDIFHEHKLKNNLLETNDLNNIEETKEVLKSLVATGSALCSHFKINLISSSPLMQGTLLDLHLENKIGLKYNPSKHLQVVRSIPADCLKSTLCGMNNYIHLKNNIEVFKVSPLTKQEFYELLTPKKRQPFIEK